MPSIPVGSNQPRPVITGITRATASLSTFASLLVIVSFVCSARFRHPTNRLIFYAAWGNLLASAAIMISTSGIMRGATSPLCQGQALIAEWFHPSDALWNLCMAFNVYLTLFRWNKPEDLRKHEWKYGIFCYGVTFVPALVLYFIRSESRGRVYGPAVLWCWITPEWGGLRFATYFGPVWLVLLVTFVLYFAAGIRVYKIERGLGKAFPSPRLQSPSSTSNPAGAEAQTQSEPQNQINDENQSAAPPTDEPQPPPLGSLNADVEQGPIDREASVDSESDAASRVPSAVSPGADADAEVGDAPAQPQDTSDLESDHRSTIKRKNAIISYVKYASLFFVALLVTWVGIVMNPLCSSIL